MKYTDDDQADEIYEEINKEIEASKQKERGWIAKLSPKTRVIIIIVVGAGLWYIITNKVPFMKALPWIAFGAFVVYMLTQGEADPKKLTEAQTAACLYRHLKDMQRTSFGGKARLGPGRIKVNPEGKELWLRGKPWKREHSFIILDENNIPRTYSADINIWDGDLISIKKRPSGYTGHEPRDIEILPDKGLQLEKRREEFLHPGMRGSRK